MKTQDKNKLLFFIDWYLPGYKGGGPIQAVRHLCDVLKDDTEIFIITSDRDLGDKEPYKDIIANEWSSARNTNIIYLSPQNQNYSYIKKLILTIEPNSIYLSNIFSKVFTLLPLIFYSIHSSAERKIILGMKGMLKQSALSNKFVKKRIYLLFFKLFRFHNLVTFHATDEQEVADIKLKFNKKAYLLEECASATFSDLIPINKSVDEAIFIFVGRIHPIKNLSYIIELLSDYRLFEKKIILNIIGPIEDEVYWDKCLKQINKITNGAIVRYLGSCPNNEVIDKMLQAHILFLPSFGENYCYSIFESLSIGRPVLISDQTPWRELKEKSIGWDIPLSQKEEYLKTILEICDLSQNDFNKLSINAVNYINELNKNSNKKKKYVKLLFKNAEQ